MRVDDCMIYTSEGCIVELQLEKIYRKVYALSAKAFSLKAAFGNTFFERPY